LLDQLPPAVAMRRWMDLFGDWIATKNGMLDTLLAMIETGEIAHGQTRIELLAAIPTIAASLIGIFTVAPKPQREALASQPDINGWETTDRIIRCVHRSRHSLRSEEIRASPNE
jgi:hypothetical protein